MTSKILFLCPHGAAKSVLAAAYFNQLAAKQQLAWVADAAGTEPDEAIAPAVAALLHDEQMDVSGQKPHRVTAEELAGAQRVVSMGCALQDLELPPERVEQWLDVPMVSRDLLVARDAIRAHVQQLISEISEG